VPGFERLPCQKPVTMHQRPSRQGGVRIGPPGEDPFRGQGPVGSDQRSVHRPRFRGQNRDQGHPDGRFLHKGGFRRRGDRQSVPQDGPEGEPATKQATNRRLPVRRPRLSGDRNVPEIQITGILATGPRPGQHLGPFRHFRTAEHRLFRLLEKLQ